VVPAPERGAALLKTRVREGDGLLSIKGNGRSGWLTGSKPGTLHYCPPEGIELLTLKFGAIPHKKKHVLGPDV